MKLNCWGKFVDDNDHFAEYDVDDSYTTLIVTLINKFDILKGDICDFYPVNRWDKIKYIGALNEYLNYNVKNFNDFTIANKLVDIDCGDIKMPISILKSSDNNCEHRMVVVGEPGEVHYLLKENRTLIDCINNNQGLISFSIKSGEELTIMKNYINNRDYIREEYNPGCRIRTEIFDLRYLVENYNAENKKVCQSSAFDYPEFFNYSCLVEKIWVTKQEDGKYEIDIRDCDGRPVESEIREGDSLYSVYYQYMIEKGHYIGKEQKGKELIKAEKF